MCPAGHSQNSWDGWLRPDLAGGPESGVDDTLDICHAAVAGVHQIRALARRLAQGLICGELYVYDIYDSIGVQVAGCPGRGPWRGSPKPGIDHGHVLTLVRITEICVP